MNLRFFDPDGVAPPLAGAYSHVARVETGDAVWLHLSGQLALDADGTLVGPGDMRTQTEQAFRNLQTLLAAHGATFADVVKITSFVTDLSELTAIREVRAGFLSDPPPTSTTVQVAGLALPEAMIEVEVVAVIAAP